VLASLGELVLASRSPQRRAILEQLGVPFRVVLPAYEEHDSPGISPLQLALEHARGKAHSVEGPAVLGVDTVVAVEGESLGKPRDVGEAQAMLRRLAGRTHTVHSGLCLILPGAERSGVASTDVRFRSLGEDDLRWYVACGEWQGRAGGYAVQGRGAALVEGISGDYPNVVGLPVALFVDLLLGTARVSG
jgi:septum formation protein